MADLKIINGGTQTVIQAEPGRRIADILRTNGFEVISPCGGRGVCGKCAVMLSGQVSSPAPAEQKAGVRLACQAVLEGDAEVILPREQVMEGIELAGVSLTPAAPMDGEYGAAVDIGTTTIAMNLYDLRTGDCLARCGMPNPQISVGADVMSRIGASMAGSSRLLQAQVTGAVNTLLAKACSLADIDISRVGSMTAAGNTTMLYLLTGRDPTALSHAPFTADCLFGETLTICGRNTFLPHCMHAFVGADITCAVLASGLCGEKGPALLCDVGTNGEIALWKDGELLVTSTAAGPAFEGAGISCGCGSVRGAIDSVNLSGGELKIHVIGEEDAAGVCGSGLIDAVTAALETGIVDETGCMDQEFFELAPNVHLLPGDIRAVQLAKAAIAAGIETLLEEADISADDIDVFYIAGGFGSHLNLKSAAAIGLFPESLTSHAKTIGNAALTGAAQMLLDRGAQRRGSKTAMQARHINLGGSPRFNRNFMEHMMFL